MTSTLPSHVYTDWLPSLSLRDRINIVRQYCKFKWVPFRGYYRYRSYKYLTRIDPEMGLLRFLMNRSVVSLDVGANLGLFTYFLARYSRHVHAFEPNPLAFDILRSVADRNVTVYREALTDRTGEVELLVPHTRKGWSSNGASLARTPPGAYGRVRVAARRIDDLDLPDLGFIKIDVEGHELSVLRGAIQTLRHTRPNLFIENETVHVGDGVAALFELLSDLDYDGFFLDNGIMTSLSRFSPQEHQTRRRNDPALRRAYVKNFIFLPRRQHGHAF
jgi:FkbM family methyltransferase